MVVVAVVVLCFVCYTAAKMLQVITPRQTPLITVSLLVPAFFFFWNEHAYLLLVVFSFLLVSYFESLSLSLPSRVVERFLVSSVPKKPVVGGEEMRNVQWQS